MNNLQSATTPAAERKYQVSVNRNIINKTVRKERFYTQGFEKRDVTIPELLGGVVSQGYAHTCGVFRANRRIESNYRFAQLVEIDIDGELTLEQANDHPIIKKFGRGIYTTSSHQISKDGNPGVDRYRVVFASPRPITSAKGYRAVQAELLSRIKEADQACKDPLRPWFGNTNTEYWILDGEDLDQEILDAATERMRQQEQREKEQEQERERLLEDLYSSNDRDSLFKVAVDLASYVPPRQKSGNTYPDLLTLKAGLVSLLGREDAANVLDITHPADSSQGWRGGDEIRRDRTLRGTSPKRIYDMAKKHGYQGANPFKREPSVIEKLQNTFKARKKRHKADSNYVPPEIEVYKQGERDEVWNKYDGIDLVDKTVPGGGKSRSAGLEDGQALIVMKDHRNPTTKEIEANFVDMPTRVDKYYLEEGRKTPLGYRQRKTVGSDDQEMIEGNCPQAKVVNGLKGKGYEALAHDACSNCLLRPKCLMTEGMYLHDVQNAVRQDRIRLHQKSLRNPEDFNYSEKKVKVDEASDHLEPTETRTIKLWELQRQIYEFLGKHPKYAGELVPLLEHLKRIRTGEIKPTAWGINHDQIISDIGGNIDVSPELLADVQTMYKYEEIFPEHEKIEVRGAKYKQASRMAERLMWEEAIEENLKLVESLPPNAFGLYLEALSGQRICSLRSSNKGEISITYGNQRVQEIVKATGRGALLLDATADEVKLAYALGKPDPTVLKIVEQSSKPLDNVTVEAYRMDGVNANTFTENALKRLKSSREKILSELLKTYERSEIKLIGPKAYKEELGLDGWNFNHNRAQNEWYEQGVKVIIQFGRPMTNIGQAEDEYRIYRDGNMEGFSQWYERKTQAEEKQCIGRFRAQYREEESLKYIVLSSHEDFSHFFKMGCDVQYYDSSELGHEATKGSKRVLGQIMMECLRLAAEGKVQPTLTEIAANLNLSKGRVSQVVKQFFGGWQQCLISLLECLNKKIKRTNEALDDWYRTVLAFDPVEAAKECIEYLKTHGKQEFLAMFETLSMFVRIKLIATLILLEPSLRDLFGIDEPEFTRS